MSKEVYRQAFGSLIQDSQTQDYENGEFGTVHYQGSYRILIDGNFQTEFKAETTDEAIKKFKAYFNPKVGDITTISGNGEEYDNVEITTDDNLPRGCNQIAWILNEINFSYYTIYEDCVTHQLYAVKEDEDESF